MQRWYEAALGIEPRSLDCYIAKLRARRVRAHTGTFCDDNDERGPIGNKSSYIC